MHGSSKGPDSDRVAVVASNPSNLDGEPTQASTLGAATGLDRRGTEPGPGALIDRFVVLARIGGGGMGVVFAAHDPQLDRQVALKLLRSGRGTEEARARLLREARALAKLSHPNVVTVHDVGVHEGRVWLAMELVAGQTLSRWSERQPRGWSEVLDVMRHAGRGLAAAHAAGLLHRDIKPDNIMLREDGRVCVMDFGLVRARADTSDDELSLGSTPVELEEAPRDLTGVGALLGTPSYMAPEQYSGDLPDVRTDQFSFCVALWQLLFRALPFQGDSVAELAHAVIAGELRPPPPAARVPTWLRRICERGLATEPEARWPSLELLLSALEHGQARARQRVVLGGALVVVAGVIAGLGWQRADERQRLAECEQEGAAIESTWNASRRTELDEALARAQVIDADVVAARFSEALDRHAIEWRDTRSAVCRATEVERAWEPETLELAQWCLAEQQMVTDALLTELLRDETPALASRALGAATHLPTPAACGDVAALERNPAPPLEQRDAARGVRAQLARVAALLVAGRYDDAVARAQEAAAAAEPIGWPPLSASAQVHRGRALQRAGRYAEAEQILEDAYFEAARAGAPTEAAEAARSLISLVGTRLARHDDGLLWGRLAEVALVSAGELDGSRMAAVLDAVGGIHASSERYDEARTHFERALVMQEATLGEQHPDVALTLTNLALVRLWTESPEAAEPLMERALAIQEQALGPNHPSVAFSLNNLASVARRLGRLDRARSLYERALRIRRRALGDGHVDVAQSLTNLGNLLVELGVLDEAKVMFAEALAIFESVHGKESSLLAFPVGGLAKVAGIEQRWDEAVAWAERLLALPGVSAEARARAELMRVRGLWAQGQERERARTLAEQQLTALREQAAAPAAEVAVELERWLADPSKFEEAQAKQASAAPAKR